MNKDIMAEDEDPDVPMRADDVASADNRALRALAERRLRQIADTLGLEPDHFEKAHHAAARALDGAHDRILSDQSQCIATALAEIPDILIRASAAGLIFALADDEKPDATA